MLDTEKFVEVGYIQKGHGYKGHARIVVFDPWEKDLADQDFVFLQVQGYKVPFFIEQKVDRRGLIFKLEHIDSPEDLKKYQGAPLFLLEKDIRHAEISVHMEKKTSSYVGLTIHDQTLGDIGTIIRIDEYPQQEMGVIIGKEGQEVLIPMHPSLILETDLDSGVIKMDLPEGLV